MLLGGLKLTASSIRDPQLKDLSYESSYSMNLKKSDGYFIEYEHS